MLSWIGQIGVAAGRAHVGEVGSDTSVIVDLFVDQDCAGAGGRLSLS